MDSKHTVFESFHELLLFAICHTSSVKIFCHDRDSPLEMECFRLLCTGLRGGDSL